MRHSRYHNKLHAIVHWFLSSLDFSVLAAIVIFLLSLLYGVLFSYLLRTQFIGINSLIDSLYYTVVIFSTLGDGAISPKSDLAKFLVISMVIIGFGNFAVLVSVIFYRLNSGIQKMVNKFHGNKLHMKHHIILCGYSVVTELLILKFQKNHTPFILLDNAQHPELKSGAGGNFLYVSVPSRLENLVLANIELCSVVITSSDLDSENILASINANKFRQEVGGHFKIVTRILYEENIEVAKLSGADHVISPTLMAANAIFDVI
jgi:voltage-gated potassium channel